MIRALACFTAFFAAIALAAAAGAADQPEPAVTVSERVDGRTAAEWAGLWRAEVAKRRRAEKANRWHASEVRRLRRELRQRYGRVDYAIRLAAVHHGVSEAQMRRVAFCESRLYPYAANRRSSARGLYQYLDTTWSRATRLGAAGFSRYDPVAAALATARIVKVEGWRQWECAHLLGIR